MKKRCVVSKAEKMQIACFFLLARIDRTEGTKRALHERDARLEDQLVPSQLPVAVSM